MNDIYALTAVNLDLEQRVSEMLHGGDKEFFDLRRPDVLRGKYDSVGAMRWGLGGSGVNVLAGIALLSRVLGDADTRATCIGNVGTDDYGVWLLEQLEKRGIDTRGVGKIEGASGTAFCATSVDGGEREIWVNPWANDIVDYSLIIDRLGKSFFGDKVTLFCSSFVSYHSNASLMSQARMAEEVSSVGGGVMIDPGYLHSRALSDQDTPQENKVAILTQLKSADVIFVNEEELKLLSSVDNLKKAAERALELGASLLVVKLGGRGCEIFEEGESLKVPTVPIANPNTLGAGDSFDAGFIYAWTKGAELEPCANFANKFAGINVRYPGAQGYIDEVESKKELRQELVDFYRDII